MSLAPGSRFGSYEILALLGAGGMGEVYRARDSRLRREVAIKVLPEVLQTDPARRARFEREAQTASNLNHPNILTIFEIGEADGVRFIAAEFVAGETLGARLARGPLSVPDALEIATQVVSGVAAAHDTGIVHRDLKPDNVMIRPDGLVKVLDFGLAKHADGVPSSSLIETRAAMTREGMIAGTAHYMSPEQARGLPVDVRSDVFSLGAMIYEMLAGQTPFQGPTATDVMAAILERQPTPLSARGVDAPREMQAVIARCLEKDPSRRFGSARELLGALHTVAASAAAPADNAPSIAILPFSNMSTDPENEYFCDGIAEEITNALVKVERLKIAGRTSAFAFKGKTGDLREIGRTLGVNTVLEGSVRKSGSRLRITAQLVKVADGYHLWSDRYDRQMEDIFEVQDEIALAVVEALKVTLLGREKAAVLKRSTDDPEAYNLCLKARHAWTRWTDEGFRTAISLFEQALEKDPDYALAHFGVGDCLIAWPVLGRQPADRARIRRHLETALRLDPDLPEAGAVLGGILEGLFEWNWPLGERQVRKAMELSPRSWHVNLVYGLLMCFTGRVTEAVAAFRRSVELDPLNPFANTQMVYGLVATRDWEAALRQLRTTLDIAPDYWLALAWGSTAWIPIGRVDEAIAGFERAVAASHEVPYTIGLLGHALATAGRREEAMEQLERLHARAASAYVPPIALALIHAGLGQVDEAFAHMSLSLDEHDNWLVFSLATNLPTLEGLRPDPRFAELRRRIGLNPVPGA